MTNIFDFISSLTKNNNVDMNFRKTLESKENNEKVKNYKIQMMYTNFQFYIRQSKSKIIIFKMNFSYNNFA